MCQATFTQMQQILPTPCAHNNCIHLLLRIILCSHIDTVHLNTQRFKSTEVGTNDAMQRHSGNVETPKTKLDPARLHWADTSLHYLPYYDPPASTADVEPLGGMIMFLNRILTQNHEDITLRTLETQPARRCLIKAYDVPSSTSHTRCQLLFIGVIIKAVLRHISSRRGLMLSQ